MTETNEASLPAGVTPATPIDADRRARLLERLYRWDPLRLRPTNDQLVATTYGEMADAVEAGVGEQESHSELVNAIRGLLERSGVTVLGGGLAQTGAVGEIEIEEFLNTTPTGVGRMEWYAVRCVVEWDTNGVDHEYEERVVLVEAESFDAAITTAEQFTDRYTDGNGMQRLDFAQAFRIGEDEVPFWAVPRYFH